MPSVSSMLALVSFPLVVFCNNFPDQNSDISPLDQEAVTSPIFKINNPNYGKMGIKLLYVDKTQGARHSVEQVEVNTRLQLNNTDSYEKGDNSYVISTDTQKNAVFILAKLHGVGSPENFAVLVANHFLHEYPWVTYASVEVNTFSWERIIDSKGWSHNHAFLHIPTLTRVGRASVQRGQTTNISAGIRGLRVLKTTQSAFQGFVDDKFTILEEDGDRVLSTVVTADWKYTKESNDADMDFDAVSRAVKDIILEQFAGPADVGVMSKSVQETQYKTEMDILKKLPEIESIKIQMPNAHYFDFDFTAFAQLKDQLDASCLREVYIPVANPSGIIESELKRE